MPQKPVVLIVDDEQPIRDVLRTYLMEDYTLLLAEDGWQAVELAQNDSLDLILMDIKMPRLNGWEAINEIRARGSKIPIIVMSGFADSWDPITAQKLGVRELLSKPFDLFQLRQLIRKEIRAPRV
jgi:two-component system response regulator (stage 0 sporulation protein F)